MLLRGRESNVIAAFLILAHSRPKQVARLVKSLPAASPIVVHFDARADPIDWAMLTSLLSNRPNIWFARRRSCFWGTFSLVEATIEMMRTLAAKNINYDRVTLLSGADYPLLGEDQLKTRLAQAPAAEHLESFALERPNRWDANTDPFRTEDLYGRFHIGFRSRSIHCFAELRAPWGCLYMAEHNGGLSPGHVHNTFISLSMIILGLFHSFATVAHPTRSFFRRS